MQLGAVGLKPVTTPHLQALLRAVHRGELPCPIDATGLARNGLQYMSDNLGHLRGLDKQAVIAVIVAVLAERR